MLLPHQNKSTYLRVNESYQRNESRLLPCMRGYDHPRPSNGYIANSRHIAGDLCQPFIQLSSQLAFGTAVPTASMLGFSDIHDDLPIAVLARMAMSLTSISTSVFVDGHTSISSLSELPLTPGKDEDGRLSANKIVGKKCSGIRDT